MGDFPVLRFCNNIICYRRLGKWEPIKPLDNSRGTIAYTNMRLLESIKESPWPFLNTFLFPCESLFVMVHWREMSLNILDIMQQTEWEDNTFYRTEVKMKCLMLFKEKLFYTLSSKC